MSPGDFKELSERDGMQGARRTATETYHKDGRESESAASAKANVSKANVKRSGRSQHQATQQTARAASYFVAGTDTGVGKTLVASAMIRALATKGVRVAGMKPVAAGAELSGGIWRNEDADALAAESNLDLPPEMTTPYLLKTPCAPHVAAALEGITIDGAHILDNFRRIRDAADAIVVEGVGGFRVPLTDTLDTADLAVQFGLPVVLVVGLQLGCLSQALLTAEAIRMRGLKLAGWIANDLDPEMVYRAENIAALTDRMHAPLLGTLPRMSRPTAAQAADRIDFYLLPGWPKQD